MSEAPERYQLNQCNSGTCVAELATHVSGAWVHFDDYEQLQQENEAQRAALVAVSACSRPQRCRQCAEIVRTALAAKEKADE